MSERKDRRCALSVVLALMLLPGMQERQSFAAEPSVDYVTTGDAKAAKGDLDEAIIDYSQAIEINPNDSNAYFRRGAAKRINGDWKGAIADYSVGIELDPNNVSAYYNRAIAKRIEGDYRGAKDDYTRVIELDPKNAFAYYNRGGIKWSMGDFSAQSDEDRAFELDPRLRGDLRDGTPYTAPPANGVGEALAECDRQVGLRPNSVNAYCSRGAVKLFLGDDEGARKDLNHAIQLDPKFALAYYYRAKVKRVISDIADLNHAIQLV